MRRPSLAIDKYSYYNPLKVNTCILKKRWMNMVWSTPQASKRSQIPGFLLKTKQKNNSQSIALSCSFEFFLDIMPIVPQKPGIRRSKLKTITLYWDFTVTSSWFVALAEFILFTLFWGLRKRWGHWCLCDDTGLSKENRLSRPVRDVSRRYL